MAKKIFFSYGTVGLMEKDAYTAASRFLNEYYRIGPPDVLYKYDPYVSKLKDELAVLLNCDPTEVTYIKNTTEGTHIATEALPLKKGDEVLILGNEYPASMLSWLKKKKDGIDLKIIPGRDSAKTFEVLIESIGPKTKVIAVSWAQHYDGYMTDLDRLSDICREHGIYLVVDAVQGIGIRELDLKKTRVDILMCGAQKYLGCLMGIGFIYVNRELMPYLKDTKVGIRSMIKFDESAYELKNTAARFEDGTQNLIGIVALEAAVKYINKIGIRNIEQKNIKLLETFKEILHKNDIPFIDHKRQSNIIALRIYDPMGFTKFLAEEHIYIKSIKDVARISFKHTSSVADFKVVVAKTREWLIKYPNRENLVY